MNGFLEISERMLLRHWSRVLPKSRVVVRMMTT